MSIPRRLLAADDETAMHSFIDTILTYFSKAVGPALLAALLLLMCYLAGLLTVTLLTRMGGGSNRSVF